MIWAVRITATSTVAANQTLLIQVRGPGTKADTRATMRTDKAPAVNEAAGTWPISILVRESCT